MPRAPEQDCWLHAGVRVDVSPIAGRGLFASEPIPAGTPVSRLGGRLVGTAELLALFAAGEGDVDAVAVDASTHLVLPDGTANHFGNHSCQPNLGWSDEYTLVTMRAVVAGEELTNDYAASNPAPEFLLRCHCETYRCRQMVTGDDWRIADLQRRYAGYWTPYLEGLVQAAR